MAKTGMRTRAIHGGEAPDPVTGASVPNLVMSTNFAMSEPAGFSIHSPDSPQPYVYTRWGNPTVRMLEEKLAALEGAEDCVAFASGMAATTALLLGTLTRGDHLVISDVNYPGTAEFARGALVEHGIAATPVDTSDLAAIEAALRPETMMIWIETPANPILRLADIAGVAAIAKRHGALLAVDSTFATPVATRPIELGADFVVHSLTKYIGGHGDALGGAVLGATAALEPLRKHVLVHLGGALSPFNAWLIARGATTLPIRMQAHEAAARQVAGFFGGASRSAARELPWACVASATRFGVSSDGQFLRHVVLSSRRRRSTGAAHGATIGDRSLRRFARPPAQLGVLDRHRRDRGVLLSADRRRLGALPRIRGRRAVPHVRWLGRR